MVDADDTKQQRLHLASHVRACAMSDQVLLLDLRRSRYLAVGLRPWEVLSGTADKPFPARRESRSGRHDAAHKVLDDLQRQGVLTRSPAREPRDASNGADSIETPDASLDVRDAIPYAAIGARRIWRFVLAALWAAAALRLRSLRTVADRVSRRWRLLDQAHAGAPGSLHDAVAAFDALRPLLFTAKDKCLYDSLALVHFLASEGLRARWVIGVKTQPFGAHSWVQAGSVVLNDLHENVRSFKPILVV